MDLLGWSLCAGLGGAGLAVLLQYRQGADRKLDLQSFIVCFMAIVAIPSVSPLFWAAVSGDFESIKEDSGLRIPMLIGSVGVTWVSLVELRKHFLPAGRDARPEHMDESDGSSPKATPISTPTPQPKRRPRSGPRRGGPG